MSSENGSLQFNTSRKNQMGTIQTIKLQASLIGLISTIKSDLGFGVIKKMRTIP
jgi:hypothetical protein